jgi:hypothetical protein
VRTRREAHEPGLCFWVAAVYLHPWSLCSTNLPWVLVWEQASLAMPLEAGSHGWADARSRNCVSRL